MLKIGLIAMSAKPFHAGHDMLIRIAAEECDIVKLYVSTSDRARAGEVRIKGSDMQKIWHEIIEPTLPKNTEVLYGGSPVSHIWRELGNANETFSDDTYYIYSDPQDIADNFPYNRIAKYCGNLLKRGKVFQRAVRREETVNTSGTEARMHLKNGDKASFLRCMPKTINGNEVWDILYGSLIVREFVERSVADSFLIRSK